MANTYKLSHTAKEVDDKLTKIAGLAEKALIVTLSEDSSTASHTAVEIYDFVRNGGNVLLKHNAELYYNLTAVTESDAFFTEFIVEECIATTVQVYSDGTVDIYERMYTPSDAFNDEIKPFKTLVVTYDSDTGKASHTSLEIYDYVSAGGTVLFHIDAFDYCLSSVGPDHADFNYITAEDGECRSYTIFDDGSVDAFNTNYASADAVQELCQDISQLVTRNDVNNSIAEALDGYATESYVDNSVAEAIAEFESLTPEFVDSIEACVDTSKMYVLPDGYIYSYMKHIPDPPAITYESQTDGYWYGDSWNPLGYWTEAVGKTCAKRTNVIPVTPGDTLTYKGNGTATPDAVVWLDADKKYISDEKHNSTSSPVTLTVPSGAYFAWFSSFEYTTNIDKVVLEVQWQVCQACVETFQWMNTGVAFTSTDYGDKIEELEQEIASMQTHTNMSHIVEKLAGKKLVYDGDSICQGYYADGGYPALIAAAVNGTYINQAVGGGRLCANSERHSVVNNIVNLPTDGDLYCFQGGINDFWGNTPVGECSMTDYTGSVDTSTICGALEYIFRYALENFVGKPICFIITHKIQNTSYSKNSNGNTFWDYREAMIKVCEKYSIPYYDAFANSGLNGWNTVQSEAFLTGCSAGTGDGTHPNTAGYQKYYVPQLLSLFRSLI